MKKRCGVCDNCRKVERTRKLALAAANPPFSHAEDDVVMMWNDALRDWPCTKATSESHNHI